MASRYAVPAALLLLLAGFAAPSPAQNLLANPSFNTSLDGWQVVGDVVSWDGTRDFFGSPISGSARIVWQQSSVTGLSGVVSQCVEVTAGMAYQFGGGIFIPSGQATSGSAFFTALFYPTHGCSGPPPPGASVLTPTVTGTGSWIEPVATATAFGPSVLVSAVIAPAAGGTFQANFDEIFLQPTTGNCHPANNQELCLNDRFKLTATFDAGNGLSGQAQVLPASADTGLLWFFSPANIEAVVKVLDGCADGGHHWVFAGGLTNVGVTITVLDTRTSTTKIYTNPIGKPFAPIQDTSAFACP